MSSHTEERNSDFQGVGHPHWDTVRLEEELGNRKAPKKAIAELRRELRK